MGSAEPDVGTGRFGDYQLVRRIAVGGMAEIFEARCLRADAPARVVALKILLPQFAQNPEFIRMLRDEARIGQMLSHPNLVRLFEMGRVGSQTYLAMELVDGVPLSDLLRWCTKRGERLPIPISLFVVEQVLHALAYVHEATDPSGTPLNVIHRDVTPHNVLLSRQGQVRLGDFGIARSTIRDDHTRTGVIKGKVRYLAPEQVTRSAVDARTDLYAVGLMLFEMATGTPFLRGDTDIELLREAENPPFRPPSLIAEDAACLDDVVRHALGRFPEERYASARAFLRAVESLRARLAPGSDADGLAAWVERSLSESSTSIPRVSGVPELALVPSRQSTPTVNLRPAARPAQTAASDTIDPASGPHQQAHVRRASRRIWPVAAALALMLALTVGAKVFLQQTASPQAVVSSPARAAWASSATGESEPATPHDAPSASLSVPTSPSSAPLVTHRPPARPMLFPSTTVPAATLVTPSPNPDPDPSEQERALRQRLGTARTRLAQRGILLDDLTENQRASLQQAEQALAAHDNDLAASTIAAFEASLDTLRVDGPFVRRKMSRVDAALQAARRRGVDISSLQSLSAQALQAYMEGQYEQTNATLNVLLTRLAALRNGTSE